MYNIGDYVIYKRDGVCRIEGISHLAMAAAEKCLYYHLRPVKYEGRIYVPVDQDGGLRPLIGSGEARALLDSLAALPAPVSRARDKKSLQEHYDALLSGNTCDALARTVKSIYAKHMTDSGTLGRLSSMEEQILRRSEQALCEELALALGLSEESVRARIEKTFVSSARVSA